MSTPDIPFQEIPGESPESRTMRFVATHSHIQDHIGQNLFAHETGLGSLEASVGWKTMPEAVREEWRRLAIAKLAEYHAMSPAQRRMVDRGATKRLLEENDRRFETTLADIRSHLNSGR
jgi:hypothetical protein